MPKMKLLVLTLAVLTSKAAAQSRPNDDFFRVVKNTESRR